MKKFLISIFILKLNVLSYLPLWVLYGISNFLYIVFYKLIKYRLKVVKANIDLAFPEMAESEKLILEKSYYSYLSDLVVETLKGFSSSEGFLRNRIEFKNLKYFDSLYTNKQSAIVVMGHCGNWEWVCKSSPLFMKNKVIVVYKPLTNKQFDTVFNRVRTKFGVTMVPMAQIARYLLAEKEPYLLILLSDQSPSDDVGVFWTKFFGTDTAVLPGIEKLALKFKLPIYYNDVKRIKRGHYECTIEPLFDINKNYNPGDISQIHTEKLELEIRKQKETWLWSHRRWKIKKVS